MSELGTVGFHHVTLVSADARRTARFYRRVLGLGLVKRTVNFDDPAAYHLYFGAEVGGRIVWCTSRLVPRPRCCRGGSSCIHWR